MKFKGDRTIWFVVLLLAMLSLPVVYSSTAGLTDKGPLHYLGKHLGLLAAGGGLLYVCYLIPYYIFKSWSGVAFWIAVGVMVLTFALGENHHHAQRTLLGIQTAEFAKIGLLMYVASRMSNRYEVMTDLRKGFMYVLMPMLLMCGLIFLSNFSTAAILGCSCLVVMFVGGAKLKHILGTVVVIVAALAITMFVAKQTVDYTRLARARGEKINSVTLRVEKAINSTRLNTMYSRIFDKIGEKEKAKGKKRQYLNQAEYARLAIANGGLFWGKGPGNSNLRYNLSQAYSDFVYAIIVEEFGVVFAGMILLCYLILLRRIGIMVKKSTLLFPILLSVGIGTQVTLQALVNMCVATGLMPVTGQNLPLVSQGGSSVLGTCVLLGMLLSVSRSTYAASRKERDEFAINEPAEMPMEEIKNEQIL